MADDRRYSPISFTGAGNTYRAGEVANTSANPESEGNRVSIVGSGFHDIAYVKELFRIMNLQVEDLYLSLESELQKYAYVVDQKDEKTQYALSYIANTLNVSSLSNYIHYSLYKHLLKNGDSNAADYLISLYEQKMRDASGSISLDLLKLVLFISNEMTRMEEFINEFIGELDDTSEFRIIEAFQNWGEDAYNTLSNILKTTRKENRTELPASELDQLNQSQAAGAQALFKVKLNALNQKIVALYGEMYRDLNSTADVFYRNYLGRALRFRLKVSRDLGNNITTPILQREISNTVASLDTNFSVHLADLIKRIANFKNNSLEVLGVITVRDSYCHYIDQLSGKGSAIKKLFVDPTISSEELSLFENINLLKDFRLIKNYQASFINSHGQLTGLEEEDAHPQYLLKTGGVITGDIELADNVRIGGIIPKLHKHNGLDGSAKIAGGDIEFNSITDSNIDTSASPTGIPFNLSVASAVPIVGPTGVSSTVLQISFYIEDENVSGYEFEITEL